MLVTKLLTTVVLLSIATTTIFAQDSCVSPRNKPGSCIEISKCPELLALLRDRYRTPQQTRLLKNSQCGFVDREPKVCCETSGTITVDPVNPVNPVSPKKPFDESLLPTECGLEASEDKIIGGVEANIDQFPWMGLVEYVSRTQKINLGCGAALISKRYLLSAAHCATGAVITQLGNPTSIRLGDHDKLNPGVDCVKVAGGDDCNDGHVTIPIEKVIVHPQYENKNGPKNDIALFRLARDAPYTYFIRPICLPSSDITVGLRSNTHNFTVAGWGTTETGRGSSKKLYTLIPFVDLETCKVPYKQTYNADLWNKQICAGGEKGKDSCRGDSGGPLMNTYQNKYDLAGIVSFGPTPCAKEGVPGVYTKVFAYLDWIKGELKP